MKVKHIYGFENLYTIDSLGRVWSIRRNKYLKHHVEKTGYCSVVLYKAKSKTFSIHRLVAKAFLPNIENKKCVNHKNGIKTDNSLANLEWCTYKENHRHAVETGLSVERGEGFSKSKLTEEQVKRIKYGKEKAADLARELSVNKGTIHCIRYNKTWTHI